VLLGIRLFFLGILCFAFFHAIPFEGLIFRQLFRWQHIITARYRELIVNADQALRLDDLLKGDIEAAVLDRFWNRASIVAQVASQAARKLRGIAPDLVYTYALFHDAAVPVMMCRFKDYGAMLEQVEKSGASLVAEEDARYRCTHAVVGAMLARNWGLSASISSAVRFHHDREVYDLANPFLDDQTLSLIAVTHVAEHLVLEQNGEADAEVGDLFPLAVAYLGLSKDDLHDLEELLAAQT